MAFVPANSWASGQIEQHKMLLAEDLIQPQYTPMLIDAYGNDEYVKEIMYYLLQGTTGISTNSAGWNWFDELRFDGQVIVASVTGTPTATIVFVLDSTLVNTVAGQTSVYVQVGDYIQNLRNGQAGRVTAVTNSSGTISVTAILQGSGTWTAFATGQELALYTHAEAEDAQSLPLSRDSYVYKQSAQLQRFAEAVRTTSDALTDKLWFQTNESGQYVGSWGAKSVIDLDRRMHLQKFGAMELGQYNTADTAGPQTTQGRWDAYKNGSSSVQYASTATLANLQEVISDLAANGAGGPMMFELPYKTFRSFQPVLQNNGVFTNLNVEQLATETARLIFEPSVQSDGPNLTRRFDVTTGILEGQTLNFRKRNVTQQRMLNVDAANNTYITSGYVTPTMRMTNSEGNKTGVVEIRHKSLDGYNLMSTTGELGWLAAGGANSEANERKRGIRSHMGFGFRALTQTVYLHS